MVEKVWATICYWVQSRTGKSQVSIFFFFSTTAGPQLLRSRNFATIARWHNDFSLLTWLTKWTRHRNTAPLMRDPSVQCPVSELVSQTHQILNKRSFVFILFSAVTMARHKGAWPIDYQDFLRFRVIFYIQTSHRISWLRICSYHGTWCCSETLKARVFWKRHSDVKNDHFRSCPNSEGNILQKALTFSRLLDIPLWRTVYP